MKRIIELTHEEARAFFLKEESYFSFDLPKYFVFKDVLEQVSKYLVGKELSDLYSSNTIEGKKKTNYPSDFNKVNYTFLNNKDGKYAWRPFQLIHPALYVSLVNCITEKATWDMILARFAEFASNPKIQCCSIPLESQDIESDKATAVNNWWQFIEQQSIKLALSYDYVLHTDIADCYGTIYTHTVPWALHAKDVAKVDRRSSSLIGNKIDKHLQDMAYGQTNGIPQGSLLMDFIAEIVLGYADIELSALIHNNDIEDYQIIRYRDDYRIFSNNPQTAEFITKLLTEVLISLGMRLNAQKTMVSNNVVKDSIKADKLYWISSKQEIYSIQEHLLLIHKLSEEFPNSGSLTKALNEFFDRIKTLTEIKQDVEVLIDLGMGLNAHKTTVSNNAVKDSIRADKLYWISSKQRIYSIQEHLLLIHKLSDEFPNSGSLTKAPNKFFDRIKTLTEIKQDIEVLVSILVDIMYKNPRIYPIASAILSKLFSLLDPKDINRLLQAIKDKFDKIPNTGHIKIWLQRLTIKIDRTKVYEEDLCKKVNDPNIQIWDSEWLNNTLKTLIETTPIINEQVIQDIDVIITKEEVELFKTNYREA